MKDFIIVFDEKSYEWSDVDSYNEFFVNSAIQRLMTMQQVTGSLIISMFGIPFEENKQLIKYYSVSPGIQGPRRIIPEKHSNGTWTISFYGFNDVSQEEQGL